MSIKVTKNGTDIFDIEDSEDSLQAARAKGYKPLITVTKNGTDTFDLDADDTESVRAAFDKGYMEMGAFQNKAAQPKREFNKATSALQGAAETASIGFDDEVGGAFTSVAKNLGAYAGLSEPTTYEVERDKIRDSKKALQEANPMSYLGGSLVAGVAIPAGGAAKAGGGLAARVASGATIGGSQGAIQGYGNSDEDTLGGQLQDTAVGGGLGAILGGAGGALTKSKAIKDGVADAAVGAKELLTSDKAKYVAKAFGKGMIEPGSLEGNAIDASAAFFGLPVAPVRTSKAAMKALEAFKELGATDAAIKEAADLGRKAYGPGTMHNMSDETVLARLLIEGGDNPATRLAANTYAAATGGDGKAYLNLLTKTPDETRAARNFNPIEAGQQLKGDISDTYETLKKEAGQAYGTLRDQARGTFQLKGLDPVKDITSSIEESMRYKSISGSTRNVLDDVFADLAGRESQPAFSQIDSGEQFDRIQEAAQRLGKAVKWANQNELPEGQKILQDAWGKMKGHLHELEEMKSADAGYSTFKQIEQNLFKKLGTVERGRLKEIDPIKVELLFKNSATARRLWADIEKTRGLLGTDKLTPAQEAAFKGFLDIADKLKVQSDLAGDMNRFRYKDAGPSSPAIERLQASMRGDSGLMGRASQSPVTFLEIREAAAESAKVLFGKPFNELSLPEKNMVSEMAAWRVAKPSANLFDIQAKTQELLSKHKLPYQK